ncbi:WecB/TagA/CpsF family glycosyltransferase [Maritimibacter sp. UBA3975]|uniref:WecB/TagA/CpsF family glycosyltransferase n=1 Tax=Maritimibacter sp. UBA3975 TaxID=1946833 RepID=UPI0025BA5CE7|nr:WecB/TagA/CpsF family glycosyltransferase [Maritimibacter sp. UBA3975]
MSEVAWYLNPYTLALQRAGQFPVGADDFVVADGGVMARLAARVAGRPCESLSFDYSAVGLRAIDRIAAAGLRLALVGGTAQEAAGVARCLEDRHPGLDIVLARSGYDIAGRQVLDELARAEPDVVLLSVGSPWQEQLALQAKAWLAKPAAIVTCGAFVHQTARHPYYPDPIVRLNMRWLYRALRTPHVALRIARYYLPFVTRAMLRQPTLPFRR